VGEKAVRNGVGKRTTPAWKKMLKPELRYRRTRPTSKKRHEAPNGGTRAL
jgi:hypothetical protein